MVGDLSPNVIHQMAYFKTQQPQWHQILLPILYGHIAEYYCHFLKNYASYFLVHVSKIFGCSVGKSPAQQKEEDIKLMIDLLICRTK